MPIFCWLNPTTQAKYWTALAQDPNVPAGYVLTSGSDGAFDEAVQHYTNGVNSGGYPGYTGEPGQATNVPKWPNGILSGYAGGGTQAPKGWPNGK